jgi:hypothetical protein
MNMPALVVAVLVLTLIAVVIGAPGIGLWGGGPVR